MEVPAPHVKVKEKEYINYQKLHLALFYLKKGLCDFIQYEVDSLHKSLKQKIFGDHTETLSPCTCCNASRVRRNECTGVWELSHGNQCQSNCNAWFRELRALHVEPKSKIYWENSNFSLWPFTPWECAKVFMPRQHILFNTGPSDCNPQVLMTLLSNCTHFHLKLSGQGHDLLHRISIIPNRVTNDGEMKLSDADLRTFIKEIIQLLEDPNSLKAIQECKAAVENIKQLSREDFQLESIDFNLPEWHDLQNPRTINQNVPDNEGRFQVCDSLSTFKMRQVCTPFNPRPGKIINWTVEDMEKRIGKKVGGGAFGIVYRANIEDPKMLGGTKREFVIKKIKTEEKFFKQSYEKEIHYGRVLHPFINPVIARAEGSSNHSEQRFSYLLFPYMPRKDLRRNIDKENKRMQLSEKEYNYKIWSRCIYQIAQAVDYLHTDHSPVRGPIFHRDLTSNNILMDADFNIRLGDFGIAVEAKMNATEATVTGRLGTKGYHPPTMNQKYTASYDIFSVGVIMLEILTGEKAVLNPDSCLYEKFATSNGLKILKRDLFSRAKTNKFASWKIVERRDQIALLALEATSLNDDKRSALNLLQKLEELRLPSSECYKRTTDLDACASCYVNDAVQLPLKGKECLANEETNPCQPFCLHCLMNHHINPLVCPKHGKSRPPFGDHVYGVFVAGNDMNGFPHSLDSNDGDKKAPHIFIADVKRVRKVLREKYPFQPGCRKDQLKIVQPTCPGKVDKMEPRVQAAFKDLTSAIEETLKKSKMNPEVDRLPSSVFIFYFSGHCSIEKGLYLGSADETISASTTWIKEMLHIRLRVDQVLVVLDCCHAASQDFVNSQDLNLEEDVRIIQVSSCDTQEESHARLQDEFSIFTHLFCQGIQGLDNMGSVDSVIVCDGCKTKKENIQNALVPCEWYDTQCRKDQTVTIHPLIKFIQAHFDLSRDINHLTVRNTVIYSARRGIDICMGYYNPDNFCIPLHLSGSQQTHVYNFSKLIPKSLEILKQEIINYTVDKNVACDVLNLHESYSQDCKDISFLVGIYQMYGRDRNIELINLKSIYNAWACGLELEARVREKVEGLHHGHIMLKHIHKRMVENLERRDTRHVKLNSDTIQIPIEFLTESELEIEELYGSHTDFVTSIEDVLSTCLKCLDLEEEKNKVLKFFLYDQFSVLKIE